MHFQVSIIAHRIKLIHQILHKKSHKNYNNLREGRAGNGIRWQDVSDNHVHVPKPLHGEMILYN